MVAKARAIDRKHVIMHVNGHHRPLPDGRIELATEVDGKRTISKYEKADPHEAAYMAAMKALRKAAAVGATYVEICSPNETLINHMNNDWKRTSANLHPFQNEFAALEETFEDVVWLKSPK